MSLSQPTLKNPCKKFINFKGKEGKFYYFDKDLNDGKGENVEIPLPCTFIVLDQLSTIKGFSDKHQSNFYSNEVHNLDSILKVKTFKGDFRAVGKYNDIKDEVKAAGGKFAKSVYVCFKGAGLELANFQFFGSTLFPWIEFANKADLTKYAVTIKAEMIGAKKGSNEYFIPQFELRKISPETIKVATEMDKSLQGYLKTYENQKAEEAIAKTEVVEKQPENDDFHVNKNFGKSDVSDVNDMPWDKPGTVIEDAF